MSNVTVPDFGFGIRPRGPSFFPSRPTVPIMSGVAMATSNSNQPSSILLTRSSPPTSSAPARSASWAFSPWAKTMTRRRPAGAVWQDDRPAHELVGVARVDAQAQVRLDGAVELADRELRQQLGGLVDLVAALGLDELGSLDVLLAVLGHD